MTTQAYNCAMPAKLESIPDTDLHEFCRNLREQLKLTQKEIASLIGVAEASYANWENGRSQPTGQAVYKLVKLRELYLENLKKKSQN